MHSGLQRLTISQGRFRHLDLMWIKGDETAKAYFDEIIDDFALRKGTESVVSINVFV